MTTFDRLVHEIERAPEAILQEVLDFVKYLKSKMSQERFDGASASEQSLAKDWALPEEDEAWRDL
jgi:hypothetical protein